MFNPYYEYFSMHPPHFPLTFMFRKVLNYALHHESLTGYTDDLKCTENRFAIFLSCP